MEKEHLSGLNMAVLTSIFMITGMEYTKDKQSNDSSSSTFEDGKKLFTLSIANDSSVYGLNNKNQNIKITENIHEIKYLNKSKKYIILENLSSNTFGETYDMYIIDSSSKKTFLCNNIYKYDFENIKENAGNIYYLTANHTLFKFNYETNKTTKVATDVLNFYITSNNHIIYDTNNYEIHINNNKETIISSDYGIYHTDYKNKILYFKNSKLYCYDVIKDSSEFVDTDGFSIIFNGDNGFLYYTINNENITTSSQLKYKTYGKDSIIVSSDIYNYSISKNGQGVYYGVYTKEYLSFRDNLDVSSYSYINDISNYSHDYYDGVYYFDFNTNRSTKIYGDNSYMITTITSPHEGVYIKNRDDVLCKVSIDGSVEKYSNLVTDNFAFPYPLSYFNGYNVILTKNNKLYFDSSKIANNVKSFVSTGNSLAYVTNDNKVYLIEKNERPKLVIEDATKYTLINFNNNLLYKGFNYNKVIKQ